MTGSGVLEVQQKSSPWSPEVPKGSEALDFLPLWDGLVGSNSVESTEECWSSRFTWR